MKDYYYFLGIEREDGIEEIRKAYRKLSLKYHPDKSDSDPFFEKRFREIREAYEVLSDEDQKRTYDHLLSLDCTSTKSNLPPKIKSFHANKIRVKKGEEIIITWQTQNADVVKIHPFGLEKAFGERKFKVTNFGEDRKFQLIINASNTLLNQTVAHGITIIELSEHEEINPHVTPPSSTPETTLEEKEISLLTKCIIIVISLLILGLLYWTLYHS